MWMESAKIITIGKMDQKIVQLQISMDHLILIEMDKPRNDLPKNQLGFTLFESLPLVKQRLQTTSVRKLLYQVQVLGTADKFDWRDYVRTVQTFQDALFADYGFPPFFIASVIISLEILFDRGLLGRVHLPILDELVHDGLGSLAQNVAKGVLSAELLALQYSNFCHYLI